ncbi:cytochrome c biogenesis protein CcsA [Porticoccaceae bacterium]|nr:cytochrome c biogenesis protein CcsA [Porticoccaceae bacterium]
MDLSVIGMSAVALYLGGFCYLLSSLLRESLFVQFRLQIVTGAAIVLHGLFIIPLIFQANGLDLSLFLAIGLIAFIVNLIVFFSSLRKPLHSMYLALFPISVASLSAALIIPSTKSLLMISPYLQAHIVLSMLAYSLLAIAALHALLTGYQNWKLKHKRQNWLMRTFPPLQTMEAFLFDLILAGEILLTLSLLSGFLFYENLFDQRLLHKVTLSIVAWLVYAVLLWGRYSRGWRGIKAISWSWVGFVAILLGYIAVKLYSSSYSINFFSLT